MIVLMKIFIIKTLHIFSVTMKRLNFFLFLLLIVLFSINVSDYWSEMFININNSKLINQLPSDKLLFPCFQTFSIDESKIKDFREAFSLLQELRIEKNYKTLQMATIACYLGDTSEALKFYLIGADLGDHWQALQAYLLLTKFGKYELANQLLLDTEFEIQEIYNFYNVLSNKKINLDISGFAKYAFNVDSGNILTWKIWLNECNKQYKNAIRSKYKDVLGCYEKIITTKNPLDNSKLSEVFFNTGKIKRLLIDEYKSEEAMNDLKQAASLNPNNYWIYLEMSSLYLWEMDENEKAEHLIKYIISNKPNMTEAYLLLGDLYQKQGIYDDAIKAYMMSKSLRPDWLIPESRIEIIEEKINNKK